MNELIAAMLFNIVHIQWSYQTDIQNQKYKSKCEYNYKLNIIFKQIVRRNNVLRTNILFALIVLIVHHKTFFFFDIHTYNYNLHCKGIAVMAKATTTYQFLSIWTESFAKNQEPYTLLYLIFLFCSTTTTKSVCWKCIK